MHLSEKGHTYALFAIVVITCALGSLTQTVMNSMLTEVCDDFAIDAAQGQWVTTIYMLTMGVTVPVVTYLARRFSLKRLVYLALGFYLAGSVAGLFAPVFAVLIAARVLQAIATGITLPLVQSVAMTRFPRERTGTAMGIGGIAMGFAPNIGPLIGGALAGSWGWRSFYIILAGLLAVLWVANAVLVKSHGDHDTRPAWTTRRSCSPRWASAAFCWEPLTRPRCRCPPLRCGCRRFWVRCLSRCSCGASA